jgi:hypothetical protein
LIIHASEPSVDGIEKKVLRLVDAKTFSSGIVILFYEPVKRSSYRMHLQMPHHLGYQANSNLNSLAVILPSVNQSIFLSFNGE